ncbi:cyclophilin-like fold protein [uncultured Sutterella sp.]|uniref:cyclophilin-like fold protein n=1 Tax=uncultured Sutterella sp. TaxID=286133 RepID=UPI00262D7A5D|nr:cyclophilin-like fold protein [uncultured Sutterella sp.]
MQRRKLLAFAVTNMLVHQGAGAAETIKMKIQIEARGKSWTILLENNETARALYSKLPLTLDLEDLYGRELCYRFREALPAREVGIRGYEVGEVVYWPPRHSFVILYRQNGEAFDMQSVGRVESGIDELAQLGDAKARLTRAE